MRPALFSIVIVLACSCPGLAETLNSTSAPPPAQIQPNPTNCSSAHFSNDSTSLFTCTISTALAKPECAGCGLNGSDTGTMAVRTPTTRPVSPDMSGLPLCPGTTGNTMSNSCTNDGPRPAVM